MKSKLSLKRRFCFQTSVCVFFLGILIFPSARAGHVVGNGGDYIRAQFVSMGSQVLQVLTETESGRVLVGQHGLSLAQLAATLEVSTLQVVDTPLIDNSGSLVDAIGEPGRILLNARRWVDHFENQRDVYYLVFHEMLRSAAVDDDNYVVSRALKPFPAEFQKDYRLQSLPPLISQDDPRALVDLDRAIVLGSGCTNSDKRYLEFNDSLMSLDLALSELSGTLATSSSLRKSCGVALPLKALSNQRVVVTQIDWDSQMSLPAETVLDQRLELFLAGRRFNPTRRRFSESQTGSTLFRQSVSFQGPCGKEALLRLQPSFSLGGARGGVFETRRLRVFLMRESC